MYAIRSYYEHTYEKDTGQINIVKKRILSDIPFFDRLLSKTPGIKALDGLTIKANSKYPAGFYILTPLFLGSVGFMVINYILMNQLLSLV